MNKTAERFFISRVTPRKILYRESSHNKRFKTLRGFWTKIDSYLVLTIDKHGYYNVISIPNHHVVHTSRKVKKNKRWTVVNVNESIALTHYHTGHIAGGQKLSEIKCPSGFAQQRFEKFMDEAKKHIGELNG